MPETPGEHPAVVAVKERYVNGEIDEAVLEAEIETALRLQDSPQNLVGVAFLVAVSGVVLQVLQDVKE